MTVDGVEVIVEGDGPAVVFIHGWPDTYRLWDAQVAALRDRYRCIRFTLPGFEPGAAKQAWSLPQLLELLEHILDAAAPGQRVTLVLHDWGCFFGYQFARLHGARVARVVGVDVADAGSRRHLLELGRFWQAVIVGYQVWLGLAWRIGGRLGDLMARAMARAMRSRSQREYINANMGYPYYVRWSGALGGYREAKLFTPACPMLFVYGARKPFMFHSRAWADELDARPGSRVLAFDTGHWVMLARAQEFNEELLRWLTVTEEPQEPAQTRLPHG